MRVCFTQPSGALAVALVLALLSGASVGATPAGERFASAPGTNPVLQVSSLTLSAAPVTVEFPDDRSAWGRRLAAYADSAAAALEQLLGTPAPTGRIVWRPGPAAAAQTDGMVRIESRQAEGLTVVTLDDPFALMARDHGVSFATGYARWMMDYSVGRLYFAARAAEEAWWDDGVALWLTELLARRERATTPILYSLESAWARRARRDPGVDMGGEARGTPADAVRGKAYLTLRLLEAVYGRELLLGALAEIAAGGFQGVFRTAVSEALPAGLDPDPEVLLSAWLEPQATVDVGVSGLEYEGGRLVGRLQRGTTVPVPLRGHVRLANGERVPLDVGPGTDPVPVDQELTAPPVEVRLDPDNLLPDPNRGNNRHGFGDAERIRSFFPLDRRLEVGELHFDGEIEIVDGRRVEEFTVSLRNLTESPLGLGMLVSTQWIDRPIARSQRAVFVTVPAGGRTVARDFLAYPRLGKGRGRIEARYWQASDPEAFTHRILRDPADLTNSYIVLRQPPATGAEEASPEELLGRGLEVASIVELTEEAAAARGAGTGASGAATGTTASGTQPTTEGAIRDLEVSILSPRPETLPVGELAFEARVGPSADAVEAVELYVDDVLVGRPETVPFRTQWTPEADRDVFVLRAVAVGRNGGVATSTRVIERGVTAFGASVDLVTVYATVKGSDGDLVHHLEASDFRLVEDEVAQEIVQFSPGEQTAVSVALLVDTSSSMIGGGIRSARAGANRLVSSLVQEEDRAMVLGFSDRLYLYSDLISDRERLERSIEATYPDGGTALFDAIVGSLRKVNRRSGRRALVVLSDGLDTHSEFAFADVLEYTRQSDVVVYTIGLQLMHDATELGDATDAVRESVENLRALAEVTGGAAYFPLQLDELEEVYGRIAEELEGQYSLSYYPSNQQWDGRWRRLEVSLPARPGVTVQARPGYYGVRPEQR